MKSWLCCVASAIWLLVGYHGTVCRAAPPAIKNVLFIISDDLKADVLGCYGDPMCETPHIDALARQGLVFDRAYCQATWCAPSRQSLMFSRYNGPHTLNLGQYLRQHDFYSARVGKIYHMRVPGDIIAGTDGADVASSWTERFNSPGLEAHTLGHYACLNLNIFTTALENRQSTQMPHRMFVTVRYEGDGSDQPDHKSATKAIELLRQHGDEPFFLAVGLVRPHYPNVAPQDYFDQYPWEAIELPEARPGDTDDIPKQGLGVTLSSKNPIGKYPDNQKRMWSGYYATVSFMDQQVGRIVAELERLGLRDSTAIVFTSDHGYLLGEHGFWQKSNLHEEVTRVPLIVSAHGYARGRTDSLAELVDIFPTTVDLLGVPVPESVHGRSLLPVLRDPAAKVRDYALSQRQRSHALRGPDWAYMRYRDGSQELYDMRVDPQQFTNLANDPAFANRVQELDQALQKKLREIDAMPDGSTTD